MCVEFYLITKKAGAKIGLLWKLIVASVVMLVTGYFGETIYRDASVLWGVISGAAYFYIVYLIWFGEVAKFATDAGPQVAKANRVLAWFVFVGWAILSDRLHLGNARWPFRHGLGVRRICRDARDGYCLQHRRCHQ